MQKFLFLMLFVLIGFNLLADSLPPYELDFIRFEEETIANSTGTIWRKNYRMM